MNDNAISQSKLSKPSTGKANNKTKSCDDSGTGKLLQPNETSNMDLTSNIPSQKIQSSKSISAVNKNIISSSVLKQSQGEKEARKLIISPKYKSNNVVEIDVPPMTMIQETHKQPSKEEPKSKISETNNIKKSNRSETESDNYEMNKLREPLL